MKIYGIACYLIVAAIGIHVADSAFGRETVKLGDPKANKKEGDTEVKDPCKPAPTNGTNKVLKPGDCVRLANGGMLKNTGTKTIKYSTDENGNLESVDLGAGGQALYQGNGGTFSVTGSGNAQFTVNGNNNNVSFNMGAPSANNGGFFNIQGNNNTVTNAWTPPPNGNTTIWVGGQYTGQTGTGNTVNNNGEPGNTINVTAPVPGTTVIVVTVKT